MNRNAIDFTARMAEGRAVAQDRRNRGQPTGKPAKGWGKVQRIDPERGSWERLAMQVRADWDHARNEAQEAFRFAVYPERYDVIEL